MGVEIGVAIGVEQGKRVEVKEDRKAQMETSSGCGNGSKSREIEVKTEKKASS